LGFVDIRPDYVLRNRHLVPWHPIRVKGARRVLVALLLVGGTVTFYGPFGLILVS